MISVEYNNKNILIKNIGSTITNFSIILNNDTVYDGALDIGESYDFYPPKDGLYLIQEYHTEICDPGSSSDCVYDGTDWTIKVTDYKITVTYYLYSLELVTRYFLNILCNCSCPSCTTYEYDKETLALLIEKIKLLLPSLQLFTTYYNQYSNIIFSGDSCSPELVVNSGITKPVNEKLIDYKILLDYIAIYKYSAAIYGEEYIKDLMHIDNIDCCYYQYNIDINSLLNYNNIGTITINSFIVENLPPAEVGDYSITIDNRAELVLTSAMFTTLTTPQYQDPEGDAPYSVKILSLPEYGELLFEDNPVEIGQEITIEDIDAGKLKYVSPDTDLGTVSSFDFAVSDTGSKQFTI